MPATGWACNKACACGLPTHRRFACLPTCLQGRQVHMTADIDAIENVTFIYCPPERQVRVDVPLKVSH